MEGRILNFRPILFEALNSACDRLENDLRTEHDTFNQKFCELTSRVEHLEKENLSLRNDLLRLHEFSPKLPEGSREFTKLYHRYESLDKNYKTVKESRTKYKELSVKQRKKIEELEEHIKKLESSSRLSPTVPKKFGTEENILGSTGSSHVHNDNQGKTNGLLNSDGSVSVALPRNSTVNETSSSEFIPPLQDGMLSEARLHTSVTDEKIVSQNNSQAPNSCLDLDVSQYTQQINDQEVKVKQEPSSNVQASVTENFLKKNKRNSSGKIKLESDTNSMAMSNVRPSNPRKSLGPDDSSVAFLAVKKKRKTLIDAELIRNRDGSTEEYSFTPKISTLATFAELEKGNGLINNHTMPNALQPVNSNKLTGKTPLRAQKKKSKDQLQPHQCLAASRSLADEQDCVENYPWDGFNTTYKSSEGQLQKLLESGIGLEKNRPIIPPRRPRSKSSSCTPLPMPPPRDLPFGNTSGSRLGPQSQKRPASGSKIQEKIRPRTEPTDSKPKKRLRDLPCSELRPFHFKINPNFNDGIDFAFTEVVRNKNERARLPGCVDENCCGPHWRTLALSHIKERNPATDQELLGSYLGDDCHILASMNQVEKDELWLKAKMWELSNKYSKHRHRYERARSPPGFWNTDFPSTAEIQQEKAEAERRENDIVQNRYREAMRPGGRWIFLDE